MNTKKNTGLDRVVKAIGYSYQGLTKAWKGEAAFRQEIMLCAVLVPVGLWLGQTGVERALLVCVLLMVLIVELLNSAIEATVDRFGGEMHPLSGQAKDIASAAVFLSLLTAVVVWALVLLS